jgi:hypothetical protein
MELAEPVDHGLADLPGELGHEPQDDPLGLNGPPGTVADLLVQEEIFDGLWDR